MTQDDAQKLVRNALEQESGKIVITTNNEGEYKFKTSINSDPVVFETSYDKLSVSIYNKEFYYKNITGISS